MRRLSIIVHFIPALVLPTLATLIASCLFLYAGKTTGILFIVIGNGLLSSWIGLYLHRKGYEAGAIVTFLMSLLFIASGWIPLTGFLQIKNGMHLTISEASTISKNDLKAASTITIQSSYSIDREKMLYNSKLFKDNSRSQDIKILTHHYAIPLTVKGLTLPETTRLWIAASYVGNDRINPEADRKRSDSEFHGLIEISQTTGIFEVISGTDRYSVVTGLKWPGDSNHILLYPIRSIAEKARAELSLFLFALSAYEGVLLMLLVYSFFRKRGNLTNP